MKPTRIAAAFLAGTLTAPAGTIPAVAADGLRIRTDLNGRCLDVKGSKSNDNVPVVMWDCEPNKANQRWNVG